MNPAPLPSPPLLRVAVGVVINARDEVLITRRHAHLHQGGLWEFPGGKIHAHESSHDALRRELAEELAIRVEAAEPLLTIDHDYPDRSVRLESVAGERVLGNAERPRGAADEVAVGDCAR